MKVFILFMAFAAMTLAMPVAEDTKPQETAPVVPEIKIEEVKPEVKAQPDINEKEKVESTKPADKPAEDEKPADIKPEVKSQPDVIEEKKPEEITEKEIEKKPEPKSAEPEPEQKSVPEIVAAPEVKKEENIKEEKATEESKPETEKKEEAKPEIKSEQPEIIPIGKTTPEVVEAKVVEEKVEPVAKSAAIDEIIDVVSAVKTPAAIADDVIDPIAISPISESKPVIAAKSVKPEENKDESVIPASVKSDKVDEIKTVEPSKEDNETPTSAAVPEVPSVPIAKTADAGIVSADSQRVNRDTTETKVVEETKPEVKAAEETPKSEAAPIVSQIEGKAANAIPEVETPKEEKTENKEVKPDEVVKQAKSSDETKEEEKVQDVAELVKPLEPKATEIEPKPKTQALTSTNSSEESSESAEKKDESTEKDSSEENGEKLEKEKAPKS